MAEADYIVVGSGINGLVCAAMLGLKGRKVLLLERNDRIGGCIRTEAVTAPGFVHDVMATTFVLFITSPAYAALGPELEARGPRLRAIRRADRRAAARRPPARADALARGRTAPPSRPRPPGDGAAFEREMAAVRRQCGPRVLPCSAASSGRAAMLQHGAGRSCGDAARAASPPSWARRW